MIIDVERMRDILDEIADLDKMRNELLAEAVKLSGHKINGEINVDGRLCSIKHMQAHVAMSALTVDRNRLTLAMVLAPVLPTGKESTRRLPHSVVLAEQWVVHKPPPPPPSVSFAGERKWQRRSTD